jgi:hypothetical protein
MGLLSMPVTLPVTRSRDRHVPRVPWGEPRRYPPSWYYRGWDLTEITCSLALPAGWAEAVQLGVVEADLKAVSFGELDEGRIQTALA